MDRLDCEHLFGTASARTESLPAPTRPAPASHNAEREIPTPVIPRPGYFRAKHAVEAMVALVMLAAGLPIMITVALAILIFDGRPIFYRQERLGQGGRRFRIWKFRTMTRNAEKSTGPVWSNNQDPRVTQLGKWLRRSHLDELPQLFNVVSGDMNIIGPRPERPEFVRELRREIENYEDRLSVRPGITGLAQVMQGYDRCLADVQRKVNYDCEYIEKASFRLDVLIALQTIPYVMFKLLNREVVAEADPALAVPADPQHLHPTCPTANETELEPIHHAHESRELPAPAITPAAQRLRA